MVNVAIFGGTFDPPHLSHLLLAKQALRMVNKVMWIPVSDPNHKDKEQITSFEHRFNMVKLMIDNEEHMELSDMEAKRSGKSYMIDTLNQVEDSEGYFNEEIYLLIGLDSLSELHTWHKWEEIIARYKLMVYPREGYSFSCLDDLQKKTKLGLDMIILGGEQNSRSSEYIRYWLKKGKADGFFKTNIMGKLMDEKVLKYIEQNNLYTV